MAYLASVPTGTVLPFAGSTAPDGWLLCDGSAKSQTTYAALFAALGGASSPYGGVAGGNFNLPNCQGVFIAGSGSQTISGATFSRTHGVVQTDRTRAPRDTSFSGSKADLNHNHGFGTTPQRPTGGVGVAAGSNYNIPAGWSDGTISNSAMTGNFNISGGDAETRPANIAMNYIIKI